MNIIYNLLNSIGYGGKPSEQPPQQQPQKKPFELTDEMIFDYIRNTSVYKPSTKNIYINRLTTIRNCFFDSKKSLLWILLNPDAFKDVLLKFGEVSGAKSSTLTLYVTTMISIITHHLEIQDEYPDMLRDWKRLKIQIEEPIVEQYNSNKPNEKQEKAKISYDDLIKVKDSLEKGSDERLLISMYTLIPAQRSNYDSVRIYTEDPNNKTDNYLVLNDKPILVLNKYKTSRTYDTLTIPIPDNLLQEIMWSLELKPREYLFVSPSGQPYEHSGSFNQYANRLLKKVLNKDFNLTTFRHIYISNPDVDVNNLTLGEKRKLAKSMGHSVVSQQQYLWK